MSTAEDRPLSGPMYHYTSIDVLVKIVRSRAMWASNAFYMNDASEIRHGIGVVQARAAERFGAAKDKTENETMRHLVGWVANQAPRNFPFFFACFSEKRDDLNQWRSYAPGPGGVCIGFDNGQMHDCFREQGWDFMHVCYQRKSQNTWADAFISRALKAVETLDQDHKAKGSSVPQDKRDESYYSPAFESVLNVLLEVASRIKHPSFAEESEWRLASRLVDSDHPAEIQYYVGSSMIVPFVTFGVAPKEEATMKLAEVILPRTPTVDLAVESLEAFLKANNVASPIAISGVPFRQL